MCCPIRNVSSQRLCLIATSELIPLHSAFATLDMSRLMVIEPLEPFFAIVECVLPFFKNIPMFYLVEIQSIRGAV